MQRVRTWLGGTRYPAPPWADTVVVLEIAGVSESLHYRTYQAQLGQRCMLAWALERFARLLSRELTFGVLAVNNELERVRALITTEAGVLLQRCTPRGQLCDLRDLSGSADARRVLLVDLEAALLPREVWQGLWRDHSRHRAHATMLAGVPCRAAPTLVETPFLAALARRAESPTENLRAHVLSWANRSGRKATAIRVITTRPIGSDEADGRRWPFRLRLEPLENVDLLREVLTRDDTDAAERLEPLDRWAHAMARRASRVSAVPPPPHRVAGPRARAPQGVLFAQSPSGFSGGEQVVAWLAGELARRCGRPWKCAALVALAGTFADRLAQAGVDVHVAGRDFAVLSVDAFTYSRGVLAVTTPDLIHIHTVAGVPFCCAAAGRGVPLVQHVHVADEQALLLLEDQLRVASHVIAVSHFVKRRVLRLGIAPGRVRVIHNGIPAVAVSLEQSSIWKNEVRRELGLPEGARVILLPARFAPNKRQDVAVEALAALGRRGAGVHLLLIGDTQPKHWPLVQSLERQVQKRRLEGRVHFLGFRQDMARLYAAADVLLLPSEDEPFGLVILEAMAAGVPVVASRSGGIPEIIEDGRCGLLVQAGNVSGFAHALGRVLAEEDLRDCLVQQGRMRRESHFSLPRFVDEVVEVYEQVLAGAPTHAFVQSVASTQSPLPGGATVPHGVIVE